MTYPWGTSLEMVVQDEVGLMGVACTRLLKLFKRVEGRDVDRVSSPGKLEWRRTAVGRRP